MENQNEIVETATLFADGEEVVTLTTNSEETLAIIENAQIELVDEPTEEQEEQENQNEQEPEFHTDFVPVIKDATINTEKCKKLNMRCEARKDADVVQVLTIDSIFCVNISESTEEFYKIQLLGVTGETVGYCLKEFITIK